MDNLTHSLFGLTLARTPLGRSGRGTTVALLLASNVPDIDIVTTARGAASYLEWHRGPTHGPLGVIALGLLVAAIVRGGYRRWDREQSRAHPASLVRLWLLAMLAVGCHVLMDLPTSYGTRFLSPFSWTWFTNDWMPIVDIYLLTILAAGLWFGRLRATASAFAPRVLRERNAAIALSLMLVDYGIRGAAHRQAMVTAPQMFGAQLPAPCDGGVHRAAVLDHWPRSDRPDLSRAPARCLLEMAALPDPISPFRWRLIAQLSNGYEVRAVNVLAREDQRQPPSSTRLVAIHYPNQWTGSVFKAAHSLTAQTFLGFSRFPAARAIANSDGRVTVRWSDLRFVLPGQNERQRPPGLFTATVELGPDGLILRERLGGP